jgi:hypothetical protein
VFNHLRFPDVLFFTASFVGLLSIYRFVGGNGWHLSLCAFTYGVALGLLVQLLLKQPLPRLRIGVASFCGSYVLWLPVVLVTYGFALAATPIFIAYAAAIVAGSTLATLVQERLSAGRAA